MRPDQHKQKRSAQYKKKHGMTKNEAGKDEKGTGKVGSSASTGPKSHAKRGPDQPTPKQHLDPRDLPPVSSDSSSDEENTRPANNVTATSKPKQAQKNYQRRKIESNWQRYEIPPESQNESKSGAGENFITLLEGTTNAISQFRFKEEQEWSKELSEQPTQTSEFLSIDCNTLSAALSCIPLHTRLGLEAATFENQQVKDFEAEAKDNLRLYNSTLCQKQTAQTEAPKIALSSVQDADTLVNELTNNISDKPPNVSSHSTICGKTEASSGNEEPDILDELLGSETNEVLQINEQDLKLEADKICQLEDSLDEILNMGINNEQRDTKSVSDNQSKEILTNPPEINEHHNVLSYSSSLEQSGANTRNMEDELDLLLSLEDTNKSTSLVDTVSSNKKDSSLQKTTGTDDLENWLDSVLDD